jgi:hypothetical protein
MRVSLLSDFECSFSGALARQRRLIQNLGSTHVARAVAGRKAWQAPDPRLVTTLAGLY